MTNFARNLVGGEVDDFDERSSFEALELLRGSEDDMLGALHFVCDAFDTLMEEVRGRFRSVVGDRKILVVDSAFQLPSQNMALRLSRLQYAGLPNIAAYLKDRLFHGLVPENVTAFMQQFVGSQVQLIHRDVRDGLCDVDDYDGIIFGGSPASVSLSGSEKVVAGGMSHSEIYDVLSWFQGLAMESGLPVLGVCYGSHVLTKLHGGRVGKLDNARLRMDRIQTEEGRLILSEFLGSDIDAHGEAYVAHADASLEFGSGSKAIAMVQDEGVDVVQAAIHVDSKEGVFTGDHVVDLALLKKVMADGGYAGLGLQAHFELTFPHLLLESVTAGLPPEQYGMIVDRMNFTRQILGVIAGFFAKHKNFAD